MAIKRDKVENSEKKITETPPALKNIVQKMANGGEPISLVPTEQHAPDIVRLNNGTIRAYDFTLTACGIFPDDVPLAIEQWDNLRDLLFSIDGRIGLFIGDYLVGMEKIHGKTYPELAEELGREPSTLYNYHWVCKNVDFSLRKENLSFGHYNLVAGMDFEDQSFWVNKASDGDPDDSNSWSVARLRAEIKATDTSNSSGEKPAKFDLNFERAVKELTEKNWKKWSKRERHHRYERVKSILEQMEKWGV